MHESLSTMPPASPPRKSSGREIPGSRAALSRAVTESNALSAAATAVVQLLHGILPRHVVLGAEPAAEESLVIHHAVLADDPFRCAGCRRAADAATRFQVRIAGPLAVLLENATAPTVLREPAELAPTLPETERAEWLAMPSWQRRVLVQETVATLTRYWPAVEAVAAALEHHSPLDSLELLETAVPALLSSPRQLPGLLDLLLACELEAVGELIQARRQHQPADGDLQAVVPPEEVELRLEALIRLAHRAELGVLSYPRLGRRSGSVADGCGMRPPAPES